MTKEQALAMLKFIADLYNIISSTVSEYDVNQSDQQIVDDTK